MDKITDIFELFKQSNGVSTDSRENLDGKIFFALSGENFDGNKFAKAALEKGAKKAVIDKEEYLLGEDYILVEDSLKALQKLANLYATKLKIPIFGITGSNGKTTSKELIRSIVSQKFRTHATQGNLNNHIGVPLTILSCPTDTEFLLVEMGANHRFEIGELCDIAKPKFGTITNVGRAHLEGFGSFENVIKAKTELYHYLKDNGGTLFVNGSDKILTAEIPVGSNAIKFYLVGTLPDGQKYQFLNMKSDPFVTFDLILNGEKATVNSNLIGDFNFLNLQLASIIGAYFKLDSNSIKKGIEEFVPQNNRTEIRLIDSNTFVMDAYNANPSSMRESIKSFAKMGTNRILILGDMKELGDFSFQEHYDLIQSLAKFKWQQIYLVGKEFCEANENQSITCVNDVNELKELLDINSYENSHFLLKGSRSMKLENLLD